MLNVQLLLTGNELMSGDIVDTNSVYIAQQLKDLGIELHRKSTVGDHLNLLVSEMERLSQESDILIVNGGLGPTVDDMTSEALARLTNSPLTLHPKAYAQLEAWCQKRNYQLSEPNKKQAILPAGCEIIDNPIGSAPGFWIRHNDCQIICTPGVPPELKSMLKGSILDLIAAQLPKEYRTITKKLTIFGMGESGVQKMVNESYPNWPEQIELGFRSAMPLLEIKLTTRDNTNEQLRKQWFNNLKSLLGQHVVSETQQNMPATLVNLLQQQGKTMTCAESCTGGLIASLITSVAGSSNVFEAGYVTYSNRIKTQLLGVEESTLSGHGAVSEEVVRQMLIGALNGSHADVGVAVSGIAGPSGGSEEKPVGTVWLAWGSRDEIRTQKLFFPAERVYFQKFIATAGLDLLRRFILNDNDVPRYVIERQKR
ncbi:CinA family nicotinamide mononucleotide deamidase-related protein [Thalassotalea aquiviva]|uniref:CinA family nicotinamide mononucleotide deamidase-related protein n=1 Tax=Thalassotalea aquiviva TaxID=3242415 RepID=UPI00352B9013